MFLFSLLKSGANVGEIIICVLAMLIAAAISIVMHEVSHGFVALKCGDPTAKFAGRLTLNPVAHFDLIGILMLFIVGFGWAKPVPIDSRNFKNYKLGVFLVSIAGITTNLILCGLGLLLVFLLKPLLIINISGTMTGYVLRLFLYYFLLFFVKINFLLAFFNMLPLYPLDGFKALDLFLKPGNPYSRFMYRYGNFVIVGLVLISRTFSYANLDYLNIFYWGNYLINLLIQLVI